MTVDNIKGRLSRLKHLMCGYNYQATYGIDIFDKCSTVESFKNKLKQIYSDSRPSEIELILFSKADFWKEVEFGLTYRGAKVSGLTLSSKKEELLLIEQTKYKDFIQNYISDKTKIYCYPDEQGIPGYDVYWGYTFVLLNDDRPSIFIYGSASD